MRPFACAAAMLVAAQVLTGCSHNASPVVPQVSNAQTGTRGALLYISDAGADSVSIYSYPQLMAIGKISSIPNPTGPLCRSTHGQRLGGSEQSKKVIEFARGGTTRVRSLKLVHPYADACAVDANGNLAVAGNIDYDDPGALMIFKNARGKPTIYQSRKIFFYDFVGYDGSGNAFVDGESGSARLGELPADGTKLENATPKGLRIRFPGGVQNVGDALAVGDEKRGLIYHISGHTIIGKTKLDGTCLVRQFYIDGGVVISTEQLQVEGQRADLQLSRRGRSNRDAQRVYRPSYAAVVSR